MFNLRARTSELPETVQFIYFVQLSWIYTTMLSNAKMAFTFEKRSIYVAALVFVRRRSGASIAKQNYKFLKFSFVLFSPKMLNSRRFIPVFVKRVRVLQTRRAFGRISVRTTAQAAGTVQNILPR